MIRYHIEQRHIVHRGRTFHFVSYDGQPAHTGRNQPATEPTWYLMTEGKRHEVMPHQPGDAAEQVDLALMAWLDENAFGGAEPTRIAPHNSRRSRETRA